MNTKQIVIALYVIALLLLLHLLVSLHPYQFIPLNSSSSVDGYRINTYTGKLEAVLYHTDSVRVLIISRTQEIK